VRWRREGNRGRKVSESVSPSAPVERRSIRAEMIP
jgi:hypothetical protein